MYPTDDVLLNVKTKPSIWIRVCMLLSGLGLFAGFSIGCSTPNVAIFSINSDPGVDFLAPRRATVCVLPQRDGQFDLSLQPDLCEKVLIDEVESGLLMAGFSVVSPEDRDEADYLLFCVWNSRPITETHVGTYRTHRGNYRTYYETHHTSVIIPVRRRYRLGQLELAAVDSASASATASHPQRLAKLAIWMADITANGPMVFHDRPWLVAEAMLEWGQTSHWRTDYNAAIKAQRE